MAYRSHSILAVLGLIAYAGTTAAMAAEDPLGFYAGAEVGNATLQSGFEDPYGGGGPPQMTTRHGLGWNALIGIRPIRWVGVEIQYIDFGRTHLGSSYIHTFNGQPVMPDFFGGADGRSDATAAFAVAYLPLQGGFELFGKVGASRLWTSYRFSGYFPDVCVVNTSAGLCTPVGQVAGTVDSAETDLAYGGGIQFHVGAFALRVEYQAFDSQFGTPALLSAGLTWAP